MCAAASLVRLPFGSPSCGRFFAPSRPAAVLRCACPARPLRAAAPGPAIASPLRVAGPLGCPPPFALGPCAPLCGSVAARCRPCAVSSPLCAAGFLWSPLLPSGSPLRFGSARRGPPSSPPSGLRARGLLARGFRRLPAAGFGSAPGSFSARVLRPLRISSGGGSPLRPSRPRRPPWGLRGSARPVPGGLRAPGSASRPGSPGVWLLPSAVRPPIVAAGQGSSPALCALALRRSLGVAARQKGVSA